MKAVPAAQGVTVAEIRSMIEEVGDLVRLVSEADPDDKAELYVRLGLKLMYYPEKAICGGPDPAGAPTCACGVCPRGDLNPHAHHWALAPQASASAYSATRTWCLHAGPSSRVGSVRLANSGG